MNLLANAIDALEEGAEQGLLNATPQIMVTTKQTSNQVIVQIADNGMGIPEAIQSQLFEPLFTTKPMGKGTGLGLAIAHQIVVDKHNGHLDVQSTKGQGTVFTVVLPL